MDIAVYLCAHTSPRRSIACQATLLSPFGTSRSKEALSVVSSGLGPSWRAAVARAGSLPHGTLAYCSRTASLRIPFSKTPRELSVAGCLRRRSDWKLTLSSLQRRSATVACYLASGRHRNETTLFKAYASVLLGAWSQSEKPPRALVV
jgi:hypothetical protein